MRKPCDVRKSIGIAMLVGALPLFAAAQDTPECIRVTASARWAAAAYNHYVRVDNDCGSTARCQISTNVNPEPQTVTVAAGAHVEVLTNRGSPAREFTPRVSCEVERP
jgi:hypothetical protein